MRLLPSGNGGSKCLKSQHLAFFYSSSLEIGRTGDKSESESMSQPFEIGSAV